MARLSGTVSRYQDRECADTHRSSDLHISHSRARAGPQLDYQPGLQGLPSPGVVFSNKNVIFGISKFPELL